jgi:hypothetical protein
VRGGEAYLGLEGGFLDSSTGYFYFKREEAMDDGGEMVNW